MTNSTVTTRDPNKKIMLDCTEPNCSQFKIGHETYETLADDPCINHTRAENYGVTVERDQDNELWDIGVNFTGDLTVAEAKRLIDALTAAMEDVSQLNGSAA